MKKALLLTLTLALAACEPAKNKVSTPQVIDTLPDGRVIKCVVRDMGDETSDHYIYYVENPNGGTTVSTNYHTGKTQQAVVEIDGVRYVPVEAIDHPYGK